eukprot:871527-Amphidinium_carterae.1
MRLQQGPRAVRHEGSCCELKMPNKIALSLSSWKWRNLRLVSVRSHREVLHLMREQSKDMDKWCADVNGWLREPSRRPEIKIPSDHLGAF